MSKRSNFILILALVLCVAAALAVFAGCKVNPVEWKVTYVYGNGEKNLERTVKDGEKAIEPNDPVRDGFKFDYWYSTDANTAYDFNAAVKSNLTLTAHWTEESGSSSTWKVTYVYGNGEKNLERTVNDGEKAIEPRDPEREGFKFDYWYSTDANTAYDFNTAVKGDLTLTAHWSVKYAFVNLNAGSFAEIWIDGQSDIKLENNQAPYGDIIPFKVHVSPYCLGEAVVKVNGTEITADADGWYVMEVTADTMTVTVEGLSDDRTPISGVGSLRDPYVLSTPAQFKRFADAVNSASNTRYNNATVVLGADLSFNGEELEPIGLELNSTHFAGTFDGRGHTLSDFTMKGSKGLGGLFGYVVMGEVKNVNIKNAVYNIDTTEMSNYIVGGIVAYNMGSDIFGCSFDGDINVDLNYTSVNSYIGGIVGFGQGYSDTNSATVSYCTVNADFTSNGKGPLLAVGGIAGSVLGTAGSAPFLIYNSVFNGNIGGKVILAGGIAGYLREDASIANCFASGTASANNTLGYAAAGAFVGLSEQNTAITNSYADITYSAVHASAVGDTMEGTLKGDFVGNYYPDGDKTDDGSVDSKEILILNSYLLNNNRVVAKGKYDTMPTIDFSNFTSVKTLLKWNDCEWTKEQNVLKTVVKLDQDYSINVSVTFDFDGQTVRIDGETIVGTDQGDIATYVPLNWLYQGDGQNTFKSLSNHISYGLFLDADRTIRLPSAMLVSSNITVYVGFADYSSVAAEYFVTDAYGEQARLVFDDNGMLTMTYGGKIARYVYVYDGEKILIKDGYFAYMFFESANGSSLIADFYATVNGNELVIFDNLFYVGSKTLSAYKGNAVMGDWYDADQSVYTFNLDGTGLKVTTSTLETLFDYTIDGNNVTIKIGGVTYNAVLSQDGRKIVCDNGLTLSLDKFDIFAGDWETDFNNPVSVTFDGMGSMTFGQEEFGYTVRDGVIIFEKGTAIINENGLIDITFDGNKYTLARAYSYRGTWYDSGYDYTVVFEGIGVDGYGTGYDSQGVTFTYCVEKDGDSTSASGDGYVISLYLRMSLYGYGSYAKETVKGQEFITFAIYYAQSGAILDNFILAYYDPLQGDWDDADGVTYSFNGLGAYDVNEFGDNMEWVLEGEVTVTENGQSQTVRYNYNRETRKATFTYNESQYVVTVDMLGNVKFSVSGGTEQDLYAPDAYAGLSLIGEDCFISFNGKSASGRGEATVIMGTNKQTYAYTLNGLTVTLLKDNVTAYTIALDTQSGYMVLSGSGANITLGVYSPMSGNTYIASNGLYVSVGSFNMAGEAEGTIFGNDAVFLMQSEDQLAIYINGELQYYLVQSKDINNVGLYDVYGEFIAMLVIPDGLMGEYTAQDGTSFQFDGRSLVIGYYANVTFVKDDTEVYYYYSVNEDGSYSVFALDRTGEYDEKIEVYTVYTTQHDGATEYVSQDGTSIWIVAVEA